MLLNLVHSMATLIMAYGFDLSSSEEEDDDEEEAEGPSQSAYQMNKRMVPLADLFDAGTSKFAATFSSYGPDFEV